MAKAKKQSAKPVEDGSAYDVDTRPESSPYAAITIRLCFKDGAAFTVPKPLFSKTPKLPKACQWSDHLQLDTCQEVGHVLVHYLFTDTYQCLRPQGSSSYEKLVAEFTTSIQVYAFARVYEISPLEELAKGEIERLGKGLRFPVVLDQVRNAYPEPDAEDAWISSYLKAGLKSLLQNPSELSGCGNKQRGTLSVSDLLVKNLIELLCDHASVPCFNTSPEMPALGPELSGEPKLKEVEETLVQPPLGPMLKESPAEPGSEHTLTEARAEPENSLEVKPAQDFKLVPEPAPKEEEDDPWAITRPKKDKKKKRVKLEEPEPEPEKAHDDGWGSFPAKKNEKKTAKVDEPEVAPEPLQEPVADDDFWGSFASKTKKKKKKAMIDEPEVALEPVPEPPEDDIWGLLPSKKSKKKKSKLVDPEVPPETVPEPPAEDDIWSSWPSKTNKKKGAEEVEPRPEPEPESKLDDWGSWGSNPSKKYKKKKKETNIWGDLITAQPEARLGLELQANDWGSWGFDTSKSIKKKGNTVESETFPDPAQEYEKKNPVDPWAEWAVATPKKDKNKREVVTSWIFSPVASKPVPEPALVPEKKEEVEVWAFSTSGKDQENKLDEPVEPEPKPAQELPNDREPESEPVADLKKDDDGAALKDEAILAAADDWSICGSDGRGGACGRQSEHVFVNGWKDCDTCYNFVRQLSQQFAQDSYL